MVLSLVVSLLLCQPVPGPANQHPITQQKADRLPRPAPRRPKITLQQALGVAERYIKREKIDVSSHYLLEAKLIFPTQEIESLQWHFWWVSVNGEIGNYVEIIVSMDGVAKRVPSM